MKTKLITASDSLIFEIRLNEALQNLEGQKIIEIQYKPIALLLNTYFTALVIYE